MNIIIPLGGKGERFYKEGFTQPKPLISIFNKPMIYYVLDNLTLNTDDIVFVIYSSELDMFDFTSIVTKKYNFIQFIPINYQTTGAVETICAGLSNIMSLSTHKRCVLLDCDTFYTEDILSVIRNSTDNMVLFTKKIGEKPLYSYINIDSNNKITDIKEKVKISPNANTGCYVFNDIIQLQYFCKYVLENKITFNGEPYTSCVIQEMIKSPQNICVYGHELNENCVFSLGTPKELNTFVSNSYVFLFDLDGTLVNTDNIYVKVWKQILSEYNIDLTLELFHKYIHGNSDDKVVNMLIPSADVNQISLLKDNLFIENINDVTLIDGMYDFIKLVKMKGYNCSIVTNCNRAVAEAIIDYCKLTNMIDFIVVGNECSRSKPYPDPYIDAINKYNVVPNKVIIFEDSKSGLLSARQTNPACIVGVTTSYSRSELLKLGANMAIDNYVGLLLDEIISFNNFSVQYLEKYIRSSLNIEILTIEIDDKKLKGGYISDVISLKITTTAGILSCVLKLENKNTTALSIMANKLGLYERENYFYENISKYVNIKIPKFYGLIRDDDLNTSGILMENLNITGNYKLNENLNIVDIDISLHVISKLACFHSKFWNKDIKKIFSCIKKHNDILFNPTWSDFIKEKWNCFVENWKNILSKEQILVAEQIMNDFTSIQERLSNNNLTLIHGDVKSPNIFYDLNNNHEPVFLDWQYVAIGKGAQDLIFFLIESFDLENIKLNYPIFKNYYYKKLIENGVNDYSYLDYENDLKDAISYFPFFVAVWFGTTPQEELIDVNFPFFLIQKLFYFLTQFY